MQTKNNKIGQVKFRAGILGMAAAQCVVVTHCLRCDGCLDIDHLRHHLSEFDSKSTLGKTPITGASGVPGSGDVAQFTNSAVPNSNKVSLDFADNSGAIATGAIVDTISGTGAVNSSGTALTLSGLTAGTLTLNGATVTVPVPSGTQTAGSSTETYTNTILANTDTSILNKSLTLDNKVNIGLVNGTNNILSYVRCRW